MPIWLLKNWKILVAGGVILAAMFATQRVTAWYYTGKIATMERDYAMAQAQAERLAAVVRRGQDAIKLNAGLRFAKLEVKLVKETETLIREIPTYVTEIRGCVTYGLVRVLDASVLGVDPATLQLPPGQSNDSCAPVTNVDLANNIARNYGEAKLNAGQLDELIDAVQKQVALAPPEPEA